MNAVAAPQPMIETISYWPMCWKNIVAKLPEAREWECDSRHRVMNGWKTVFRAMSETAGVRIVEWDPKDQVRDIITWIEDGDELVIAVRPTRDAFKNVSQLIKDWIKIQSFVL